MQAQTPQPLAGIRVVDLTQVVAGPFVTMVLGDLGADIIKIEAPGRGDRARGFQPQPAYYDAINRHKQSITIDLKSEQGQTVARDLLADADVFVENTKPGRIDRFGLDYPSIHSVNPELIYCSITGFGHDSPYEDLPAWDLLIQAMSGIMSIQGTEDGPPIWSGLPIGDLAAAQYAIGSILAALFARERGQIDTEWIEVPMLDAAISLLCVRAGYTFGTGDPFPRTGLYNSVAAPFGVFTAADGTFVIAAGTDSLWERLTRALDRPDLLEDARFTSNDARVANRQALRETLNDTLETKPINHWIPRLHDEGVPAGPIYDTKTVWEDKHVRQRNLHQQLSRPNQPDADVIDHPVHFTELTTQLGNPPEALGESTDDVLHAHGYSSEEIATLRETGVID